MRPGLEGGGNWDENFFLEYDFTHFSGDALGHLGDILQWKWAPTMKIPPRPKNEICIICNGPLRPTVVLFETV